MKFRALHIACSLLFFLVGCAPAAAPIQTQDFVLVTDVPNMTATPTPFRPSAATDTPPPTAPPTALAPIEPPLPAKEFPTESPQAPLGGRPQYTLVAALNYPAHTLVVEETIRYPNRTGVALNEIVLAVEPNRWANCFTLDSLRVDGAPLDAYQLSGGRLEAILSQPLASGENLELNLVFEINLPAKRYEEVFGYLNGQTNLVNWYPFVVPYRDGWILHEPAPVGEYLVYDAADFDVRLRVFGAEDLVVAASAPAESAGEWTLYRLEGARTFVFSVSPQFHVETVAGQQARVTSYSLPGYDAAGRGILEAANRAVSIFSERFAPYPYQSLSVVQTDLPDGMEFDGLIFLGAKFYDEYDGTIQNNLIAIGVHEVSHQWWFGLVGSDQALEPWLDEALALYSERIFYETVFPYPVSWWWRFRVTWFSPEGWVDTTIYDGYGFRLYTNAVYLRGAQFLEAIRARIEEKAFNEFLRDYATTYAHGFASGDDFFAVLDKHAIFPVNDIVDSYFLER